MMPKTAADKIRAKRKRQVKAKITMADISNALLIHVAAHQPTNWRECAIATGESMTKTREAGYWLAGAGLITWPPNKHCNIAITDKGKEEAGK
jgi:hypothetical protein